MIMRKSTFSRKRTLDSDGFFSRNRCLSATPVSASVYLRHDGSTRRWMIQIDLMHSLSECFTRFKFIWIRCRGALYGSGACFLPHILRTDLRFDKLENLKRLPNHFRHEPLGEGTLRRRRVAAGGGGDEIIQQIFNQNAAALHLLHKTADIFGRVLVANFDRMSLKWCHRRERFLFSLQANRQKECSNLKRRSKTEKSNYDPQSNRIREDSTLLCRRPYYSLIYKVFGEPNLFPLASPSHSSCASPQRNCGSSGKRISDSNLTNYQTRFSRADFTLSFPQRRLVFLLQPSVYVHLFFLFAFVTASRRTKTRADSKDYSFPSCSLLISFGVSSDNPADGEWESCQGMNWLNHSVQHDSHVSGTCSYGAHTLLIRTGNKEIEEKFIESLERSIFSPSRSIHIGKQQWNFISISRN